LPPFDINSLSSAWLLSLAAGDHAQTTRLSVASLSSVLLLGLAAGGNSEQENQCHQNASLHLSLRRILHP
jgi:hypothetical protein